MKSPIFTMANKVEQILVRQRRQGVSKKELQQLACLSKQSTENVETDQGFGTLDKTESGTQNRQNKISNAPPVISKKRQRNK